MTVTGIASSDDFCRMLRVLYATTLEGPFEFDTSTLISALYIATEYEYPTLRNYAIRHLEQVELTAIKRIEIARKFNVPSWEKPAYVDLCNRDEAVTEEEAKILGMTAFVRVSKIREKEQRRRGREMDVEWEQEITEPESPDVGNINKETAAQVQLSGGEEPPKEALPHLGSGIGKAKKVRKAKKGEQTVSLG
ncbi:unnamed protein product [Rhizoctonia solani]|uniref:BTB domain-containing protein n=1 Tax=Rhizoctonia solani TaxID=456999 RepID=A0A8H3HHB5_9AGAM|nr:unnamed protein product [Rhizoctonia solani]